MDKAAKLVCDAIIGGDFATVIVNDKVYTIHPPTIHIMAGAISCLAAIDVADNMTMKDMLFAYKDADKLAEALSWFIKGDSSLKKRLEKGTLEEIVNGLVSAVELIDPQVFLNAVTLIKNVTKMAAL